MVDTAPAHLTSTPAAEAPDADATGDPAAGTPVGATDTDVRIDTTLLGELLLGRWAEDRRISRRLTLDPGLHKIEGQPVPEHRARTLEQLRVLVDAGAIQRPYPTEFGGRRTTAATSRRSRS